MTEIEKLKIKAADLFYAREQLNAHLAQTIKELQDITNAIQQLEKEVSNGTTDSN